MSSSSPPSYTTEDQLVKDDKQPRVTRRKSTREKEKTREGPGDLGSSRSDPSSVSRQVIERIARQSIRSSKHINAELLRQIARAGGLPKDVEREDLPKFKVITGSEATRVYEKTLREDDRASSLSHDSSKRRVARHFETRPIVFAYPGIRAGRKVVDYYMTWKGKTPKAHRLKGAGRRTDILDGEFKNLSKTLDEYGKKVNKRLSALVSPDPSTPKASTFNPILPTKVDVDTLAEPTRPAAIQVESAPAVLTTTVPDDSDPLPPPRPPYARTNSNGSAVSLPTLGLPLVVVNPDARSSSSGQDSRRSSLAIGSPSKATKEKSPLTQVLTAVEEEQDDAKSTTSSKRQHGGHESQPHRHTSSKDRRERDSSRSPNSSTESLSDSSPSRHHHKKSDKDDEILIVLLDDKQASWHGYVMHCPKYRTGTDSMQACGPSRLQKGVNFA
ncbi:hypothetical protein GYMLUDRAFT_338606 [Collybiopsis luxurians FD-317 M1]|nr:hypothetical protein GYMLUDRAFT_338606 [Collybiopsis luxurians FD-317 M1]